DVVELTTVIDQDLTVPNQNGPGSMTTIPAGSTVTGENTTESTGGAFYFNNSKGSLVGNRFLHNVNNSGDGGALYFSSSTVTMTNNLVAKNSIAISNGYASGIYVLNTTLAMQHNTVTHNSNQAPT